MNIIAIDVGFSDVKARCTDRRLSFPAVEGRAMTAGPNYSMSANGRKVRMENEQYFTPIGETALAFQRQATGRRDGSWVLSDTWTRLLCGALGALLDGDCTVRLVTGLPVNDWATYHGPLSQHLCGRSLKFELWGKAPQTITIEAVKIPAQPFGALFSAMFDAYGHALNNEYTTGMGAVVDVGGHTTNIQTVDRLATVDDMSGSRPFGLLHALDAVAQDVNREFPRLEFTAHDVAVALETGKFRIAGREIGIGRFTDHHLAEFCFAIIHYINDTLARAGRLQWVILSGGGVHAVGDRLLNMLEPDFNVRLAREPRWANVEGYLAIGRRATRLSLW